MLDLLILTEMVVFSLLVYDQASMSPDAATAMGSSTPGALPEPASSVMLTEELLSKFDNLVVSEEANSIN